MVHFKPISKAGSIAQCTYCLAVKGGSTLMANFKLQKHPLLKIENMYDVILLIGVSPLVQVKMMQVVVSA